MFKYLIFITQIARCKKNVVICYRFIDLNLWKVFLDEAEKVLLHSTHRK